MISLVVLRICHELKSFFINLKKKKSRKTFKNEGCTFQILVPNLQDFCEMKFVEKWAKMLLEKKKHYFDFKNNETNAKLLEIKQFCLMNKEIDGV